MKALLLLVWLVASLHCGTSTIEIATFQSDIAMGRHIVVSALAGISGQLLCPYVNGLQWGAHAFTGEDGTTSFMIPFPTPGHFKLEIASACPTTTPFPVGQPIPSGAEVSNALTITVMRRAIRKPVNNPKHQVGIDWEPWFTKSNSHFQTAEAVPLLGKYPSMDPNVTRQHAIWLVEAGINIWYVDWTNNLWGKQHFSQRGIQAQEIINSTVRALEVLAAMKRDEGIEVPKFVLLTGLDNGPKAAPTAVNEQLAWIYDHLMTNKTFEGLWVIYEGKPLVVVFDGGDIHSKVNPPISHDKMTLRYMGSQDQSSHLNEKGFWSWMDGSITPEPTPFPNTTLDGILPTPSLRQTGTEALTITNAFFAANGWLHSGVPQNNGATFLKELTVALKYNPMFLLICQWNEFTGQPAGHGTGPTHSNYYDSYNVTLNNDMEPTAMNVNGYRSYHGGWGFLWVNILRASIDYFHNPTNFHSTLLVISYPGNGMRVGAGTVNVQWYHVGVTPTQGYNIYLNGRFVKKVMGDSVALPMFEGGYEVTVEAIGAKTAYPLSYDIVDDPEASATFPVNATVALTVLPN